MSTQNELYSRIESACSGDANDMRTILQALVDQVSLVNLASGNEWRAAAGTGGGIVAAPPPATLSATGSNGTIVVQLTNPKLTQQGTIYHEISYSATKNFSQGVTTLPPSSATHITLPMPGFSGYLRHRTSLDGKTWSPYVTQTQPVSAGLLTSAATENGATFNQTNYAVVDSVANGSSANVRINGTGGLLTNTIAVKGTQQTILPSGTIINVAPSTDQFVAWDGEHYQIQNTLAGVLQDGWTPVGKVSVVATGVPALPTVVPVISGGMVTGYTVTAQGNGLGGFLNLTVTGGGGTGATTGTQTIQHGRLISVGPGQPGNGYGSGTTVTANFGTNTGTAGGGTAVGGNGGRLTAV